MSAADSEAAVDRLAEYAGQCDDPTDRAQHLFLALGILAWNAPKVLGFILDRAEAATQPHAPEDEPIPGSEEVRVRGKELMCEGCGATRWACLTKCDGECCGTCEHPTPESEEVGAK